MTFVLGITCWHVVGLLNNDPWQSRLLCGWHPDESALGGSAYDVVASGMPLCRTCDRATNGQALRYVGRVEVSA